MLEYLDRADQEYARYMAAASSMLLQCIQRAREGKPTYSPEGLAVMASLEAPARQWKECEIEALRHMRNDGTSVQDMAEALGRSRESVKDGIRRHLRGFDRYGNRTSLDCVK